MEQDNCCVVCGEIIPEGVMVCKCCERKFLNQQIIKEKNQKRKPKKSIYFIVRVKKFLTHL